MSETNENWGPLDAARYLHAQAGKYDALAQEHLERQPDDINILTAYVSHLNTLHPWVGMDVEAYGIPLTVSVEDDIAVPYSLPADRRRETVLGNFGGMAVRYMYDADTDEQKNKIVYAVRTAVEGPILTPFGDQEFTQRYTYLCHQGCEMSPVLPYEAHSLVDLVDDPILAEIDETILNEAGDPLLQITMLAESINDALAREEFEVEDTGINHQRASYINSLGLHEQVQLEVNDVMIGPKDGGIHDFNFSSLTSRATIYPHLFTIAPGYDRLSGRPEPLRGGPPELYAQLEVEGDQLLLAPLKSVLHVESIQQA